MKGSIPAGPFGQQTENTCALACLRYLLASQAVSKAESQLIEVLGKPKVICSIAQAACIAAGLGFSPCVQCLSDYGKFIGAAEAPGTFKPSWVCERPAEMVREWLVETVEEQGVLTAIDPQKLAEPASRGGVSSHAVVVKTIKGNKLQYLEPDPDPTAVPWRPKRGKFIWAPLEAFVEAWQARYFLALTINSSSRGAQG